MQSVLQDFPDRSAAVRVIHGQPLPIEVLDVGHEPDRAGLAALAATQLASIDPTENPLHKPAADLVAGGFEGTPYRATR